MSRQVGRVVIVKEHSNTPESVINSLFGMSYDEFISDVQANRDCKYNELFAGGTKEEVSS